MSESEPGTADAGEPTLEDLVADNPDEVARFIERLGVVNELLDTADLATAAMDDRMVEELTGTATNLGAAADGLATPEAARLGEATGENADELADAIETLARLQRSGTLDDLLAMADLLALASNAMDDEMVTDLAATGTRPVRWPTPRPTTTWPGRSRTCSRPWVKRVTNRRNRLVYAGWCVPSETLTFGGVWGS